MATYKNISAATINLGNVQVPVNGTVTDTNFSNVLTLKWFYQRRYFSLTDGTDTYLLSRSGSAPTLYQTVATWKSLNPALNLNQTGYEVDTGKYKRGDGTKSWLGLSYAGTDITAVTSDDPGTATIVLVEKLDTIETNADVTDATNIASAITGTAHKTTLLLADKLPLIDTAADSALKTATVDQLRGWGLSDVTAQQDITESTTLVNATGLLQAGLEAGRHYSIDAYLLLATTANTGFKCAFATPDTLTATTFWAVGESKSTSGTAVQYTKVTTLAGTICDNAAAVETVRIKGFIHVNAAGTLRLQIAPHASHADTFSLLKGSTMNLKPVQG